jgi:molecular chaperone GrpE
MEDPKMVNDKKVTLDAPDQTSAEESVEETGETEMEFMKKAMSKLQAELDESRNGLLLARADFDNTRKRMERDKQEAIKYGLERLFKDLLPSLDVLDKALSNSPAEEAAKAYVQGFDMIRNQFYEALEKHGLEKIEASGQSFNPDFHQAIQRVESSDVTTDTVKDVFMTGFSFNGRVIRPAMVSVFVPSGV